MTTKIALDGVGGQGVRVIAGVLGALLARMGKEVTVLYDYDSSVRGSMSDAFVIFDDRPIENPVVEDADIMLKLADIDLDEQAIRDSLPKRFVEENLAAIRFGYQLTPEEIERLARAAPPSRFQMNDAASITPHSSHISAGHGVAAGAPVGRRPG